VRLIAALSWYDEPADRLAELVASLATTRIDHLVCVDGAYAAYPDATGHSDQEQHSALLHAAHHTDLPCTLHIPSHPWEHGEVQKRSYLFAAAHHHATPSEDWIVIVDGDELWDQATQLQPSLATTTHDVAEVTITDLIPNGYGQSNTQPIRKCFRAQPTGIRVAGHHAHYITGDGTVLWNAPRPNQQEPAAQHHHVTVKHRPEMRPAQRLKARGEYYTTRTRLRLEA
jgi:hypothetical protein